MALDAGEVEATLRLRDEMSKQIATAKKTLEDFGSSLTKVGGTLTAGLTLPIAAIGGSALKMAMDAVESENLFEVSFGSMAGAARDWSMETSKALGLNQYELRRTSATLFTMFDSMGLAKEGAFAMSTGLTKLSADMASFYNMKPEEAFAKLQAGISGEAEPLKRMGILVDENTTKTYAYTHGIAAQGAELTNQQKVLARYGSIMEQTSKAQGDLARTMDSPTNQLRIMKEKINEAAVTLGTAMLPALQSVINLLTRVLPYLQDAVKWFASLPEPIRVGAVVIAALVAAIGPLLVVFGVMASGLSSILGLFALFAPAATTAGAAVAAEGVAATGAATATAGLGISLGAVGMAFGAVTLAIGLMFAAWKIGNIEGVKNTIAEWTLRLQGLSKEEAHAAVQGHAQAVAAAAQQKATEGASGATDKHTVATFDVDAAMKSAIATAKNQASGLGDVEAAQKAAAKATAEHAKAISSLVDDLTGQGAITQVNLLREALAQSGPIQAMTLDAQKKINDMVTAAIAVYKAAGESIPADLLKIQAQTTDTFKATKEALGKSLEMVPQMKGQMLVMTKEIPGIFGAMVPAIKSAGASVGLQTGVSLTQGIANTLKANLGSTILNALQGGGNVAQSIGGMLGNEVGKHFIGDATKGITGMLTSKLGGTIGGALGSVIPGLGTILGSQLGEFMMKGLSKVGEWFKGLFGVSQKEQEGRSAAAAFRDELEKTLTATELLEAGNDAWKKSVIAIRDAYLAAGKTEAEALAASDRLFRAEKEGGGAVQRVIDEIAAVTRNKLIPATQAATQTAIVGFDNVQRELIDLQRTTADPKALQALTAQFKAAADAGVTDFSFMADAIQALKDGLATPIDIAVTIQAPTGMAKLPPLSQIPSMSSGGDLSRGSATQAEIDDFLRRNPGDYDRLAQAFGNKTGFAVGTPGLGFGSFGASGTDVTLHGSEAVVPKGREDEFALRHTSMADMVKRLASIEGLLRDQPRAIGIAVSDNSTLGRR